MGTYSDGIARVHGMANVQAEELVEYVHPDSQSTLGCKADIDQVCFRCEGNVHEPRGWPGRCCVVRFRSSRQGGRDRQAYRRDCMFTTPMINPLDANIDRSMFLSALSCSDVSSTLLVTPLMARVLSTPRRSAVPSSRPPAFCPVVPSTSRCRLV